MAQVATGRCQRCHMNIQAQLESNGGDTAMVIPAFSYLNNMDPCWKFPLDELGDLFRNCTLTESMLVALDHFQVHFVTIQRTRLHKFKKNVISFPQDSIPFFARMGALRQYRVGDRVNSNRGPALPGEDESSRGPRLARTAPEELRAMSTSVDAAGQLLFPASVERVESAGKLLLQYFKVESDGTQVPLETGRELPDWVSPRVQMPWHRRTYKTS